MPSAITPSPTVTVLLSAVIMAVIRCGHSSASQVATSNKLARLTAGWLSSEAAVSSSDHAGIEYPDCRLTQSTTSAPCRRLIPIMARSCNPRKYIQTCMGSWPGISTQPRSNPIMIRFCISVSRECCSTFNATVGFAWNRRLQFGHIPIDPDE